MRSQDRQTPVKLPRLSFGIVGGAGLSEDFRNDAYGFIILPDGSTQTIQSRFYSTSKDYIVGPMVELRLPARLSLEADALYRPLNFTSAGVEPDGSLNGISPSTVVTWQFPVLLKYRFSWRVLKPFAEIGPSFRSAGNLNGSAPSHYGSSIGLGVEAKTWKLRVAPVVRYTRWAADGKLYGMQARIVRDQFELLVGISF
jgi:hypothetical protein